MSKFLGRSKEQLRQNIFNKLNLAQEEDAQDRPGSSSQELQKALRQTEKRKLSIRKAVGAAQADFSDEMAQLKWRIDVLRNFGRGEKESILRGDSLTGAKTSQQPHQRTFDDLLQLQRRKFAALKERRKSKMGDQKYLQMLGNMQVRKERRKNGQKQKVDHQMQLLQQTLQGQGKR